MGLSVDNNDFVFKMEPLQSIPSDVPLRDDAFVFGQDDETSERTCANGITLPEEELVRSILLKDFQEQIKAV